jgi:hypothetical protein
MRARRSTHFEIGLCGRWPLDEKGRNVKQMLCAERDLAFFQQAQTVVLVVTAPSTRKILKM